MIPLPYPGNDLVHGLWVGLGLVAGLVWYALEKRRLQLHDDRLWVLAGMAVAFGAVGARLLTWPATLDPTRMSSMLEWWTLGNRSILAGLVGAWIGVWLGKRLTGYREDTGELFAPAVALAMLVGRVGCLLTENPGTPTGGGWGVVTTFEQAERLGGVPGVGLHPSFAYEIAFQAVALALMLRWRGRLAPGAMFRLYVAGYAAFRFAVEFVRGNEEVWFGLTRPQWFLLAVSPLLIRSVVRALRASAPLLNARLTIWGSLNSASPE